MAHIILLTGPPRVGKTTALKSIISHLGINTCHCFFTEEIRDEIDRVGFKCVSLTGEERVIAHIDLDSPIKVGRYGIDLQSFEDLVLTVIEDTIHSKRILIIDEIGPMQLYSKAFQEKLQDVFSSVEIIIGTIYYGNHPIVNELKETLGEHLYLLTEENRDQIIEDVILLLSKRLANK